MAPKKTAQHDEEPVKSWKFDQLQSQVDRNEKVVDNFDSKLDQIIQLLNSRPTNTEVDVKIELAVKNAVEKQDLKYAPILQTNKALLIGLLTTGLGLIGSLITLAVTLATRQGG